MLNYLLVVEVHLSLDIHKLLRYMKTSDSFWVDQKDFIYRARYLWVGKPDVVRVAIYPVCIKGYVYLLLEYCKWMWTSYSSICICSLHYLLTHWFLGSVFASQWIWQILCWSFIYRFSFSFCVHGDLKSIQTSLLAVNCAAGTIQIE